MRRVAAAAAAAFLASAAPAANPAKIAVTPASPDAVLIVRMPSAGVVYTLAIARYDDAQQDLAGDWIGIPVPARNDGELEFFAERVKPGSYVIQQVVQQGRWGVCFYAKTLEFDVKPGQAVYLGTFDAARPLRELRRHALATKQLYAGGFTVHNYFDDITPPGFAEPEDATLPDVRAFIAEQMPRTTATPVLAQYRTATFRAGRALVGPQRVCGGRYSRKDKR
ncbi:MAG: hypothetical protein JO013_11675 [Alphaproteobacteria bacterium]|nr:hypothetical protein [Alphaproteobacteria bacterium]